MALSGFRAPLLQFSAGAAAASSTARRRHSEPAHLCRRSIGARRPLDLSEHDDEPRARPSRSAAVMIIMENVLRRVDAGGALQEYLTDDAGELWSGLVVDRHCCASASEALSRVVCDRVMVCWSGGSQVGCDVAGRVRVA